ncbi:MAG TPA: hypothetical protein VNA20_03860 [Frankiaceae bacterium]|nr:hypothetical protein [Frankiaceae bacterium]
MAAEIPEHFRSEFILQSEDDMRAMVRDWLERLGCTYAELEQMWRTSDYETHFHRMAWVEIGGLGHLAEG